MGAGLARNKLLAILLGPEGIGITGVIDQLVAFAAHAGSLSIPFAALRFLSRTRELSTERFISLYSAFRRTLLIASIVAAVAGIAFILLRRDASDPLFVNRIAALIAMLSAPAMAILSLERNVLAVLQKPRVAAATTLVGALALVVSTYAGVQWGGIAGLYLANLIVNVAIVALVVHFVRLSMPADVRSVPVSTSIAAMREEPGLVRFCTLVHFLALGSPAAYAISRVVILDNGGSAAAGLMAASFGIGVSVRTVLSQGNALYLTPLANQSTSKEERIDAVRHYARALSVLFVLAVMPLIVFPGLWIRLLYSREFAAAAASLTPFLIAEGLLLLAGVYQALLVGFGDVNGYVFSSIVSSAMVVLFSFALIPDYGIVGAAWALIIGNGTLLLLTLVRLRASHAVRRLAIQIAPFVIALAVLAGSAWWISEVTWAPNYGRILAYVVISLGFVTLLTKDERHWLISPVKTRLSIARR